MERWLGSKENKKIAVIIIVSFFVIFTEFTEFLYFRKNLFNLSLNKYTEQIDRVSKYVERSFKMSLEHYESDLKVMEKQLVKEKNILSDNMLSQVKNLAQLSKFSEIGISDLDGNIIDSTGERYTKVHIEVKEILEKGEVYISNVVKDDGENLIFIAIPLEYNNKIIGSLWGKLPVCKILTEIEFDRDSDRYFQIIDQDGDYILPSKNKYAFNLEKDIFDRNLWEELPGYTYIEEDMPKKIHSDVRNGKKGNFYFEYKGHGRYVSYRQLGINDWYIFSVQVKDNLENYVDNIQKLIMQFFIILIIGFIVIFGIIYDLIHSMYKKIENQYHETHNINLMFEGILYETRDIPFIIDKEYRVMSLFGYPNENKKEEHSFDEMRPENMLRTGKIDRKNLRNYLKFYKNAIIDGVSCEPIVLFTRIGKERRWIRIRFIESDDPQRLLGVLEGYDEQMEKDLRIVNQLDSIKKIEIKSQLDFLTRLNNRESFVKKVKLELEENKLKKNLYAFMIIDIDNFKKINDFMGHKMGDTVLKDIGRILQKSFRKEDIIGRLGGDEFVVFLKDILDERVLEERIKIINEKLYREYEKDNIKLYVSGSIGVVVDNRYLPFNVLYEKADKALYKVKHSGRNGYMIYKN